MEPETTEVEIKTLYLVYIPDTTDETFITQNRKEACKAHEETPNSMLLIRDFVLVDKTWYLLQQVPTEKELKVLQQFDYVEKQWE